MTALDAGAVESLDDYPEGAESGDWRLNRAARRSAVKAVRRVSDVGSRRVFAMALARESDTGQLTQMEVMIQRACSVDRSLAGCSEMFKAGMEPFSDPVKWNASSSKVKGNKSVLVMREGTLFFYWMGSAAMANTDEGDNLFTKQLIAYIERFRPINLYVPVFTRLVRSAIVSGELFETLVRYQVTIHYPGGKIQPWTPLGQPQWMLHVLFASMERNEIVARNLTGIVAGAARGICPWTAKVLPHGYVLERKRVKPDPAMVPLISRALMILADKSLSYKQAARQLGEIGLRRKLPGDRELNLGDAQDPASLIKQMLRWTDLYETGVYTMRRNNPLPGIEQIGHVPVIREHPSDDGYLDIPFEWGLPNGGWAPPAVFAAIRERLAADADRSGPSAGGGDHHQRRKPLTGFPRWEADGYEWGIDTEANGKYRLRRRVTATEPVTTISGQPAGWRQSTVEGGVVARMVCRDLHQALAASAARALKAGVAGQLEQGWHIATESSYSVVSVGADTVRADLEAKLAAALKTAATARKNANRAGDDDELADSFIADARQANAEAVKLRSRIEALGAEVAAEPEPAAPVNCDGWHIANALAAICKINGPCDRTIGDALRAVITDLRMWLNREDRTVGFSYRLSLPAEDGVLLLGPIEGSVKAVVAEDGTVRTRQQRLANEDAVIEKFRQGFSVPDIAASLVDVSTSSAAQTVHAHLATFGIPSQARSSAMHAAVPVMQRTLMRVLESPACPQADVPVDVDGLAAQIETAGVLLDDGVDPRYAALLAATYMPANHDRWPQFWASSVGFRQRAVDAVSAAGGEMTIQDLQLALGDVPRYDLTRLTDTQWLARITWNPILARTGDLRIHDLKHRRWAPDTAVTLIECPHCGSGADRVIHVPEVPSNLLCRCGHMPYLDSPRFPDAYAALPPQMAIRSWPEDCRRNPEREVRTLRRRAAPTPEQEAAVVAAYRDSKQPILGEGGICVEHDISPDSMYRILARHQVPKRAVATARRDRPIVHPRYRRPKRRSDETVAAILAAYQDPSIPVTGPDGICTRFDVSTSSLYRILDRAGVDLRRNET